jgi:hypothetical protein
MVEVNVRQQDPSEVAEPYPLIRERAAKGRQAGGRPGIDEPDAVRTFENAGRDDPRIPLEMQIGVGDAACKNLHGL